MDDPEPKREGGRAARRASITHDHLIQAALAVFNAQGVDGCAIEDITEKADVGKGTFYRHFRDKHGILTALVQVTVADIETRLLQSPVRPSTLEAAVSLVITAHVGMLRERSDLFLLLLQTQCMLATRPVLLPDVQQAFSRYWELLDNLLAVEQGSPMLPTSLRMRAVATSGMILGFVMQGLGVWSPGQVAEALESACPAITNGIIQHLRCAV